MNNNTMIIIWVMLNRLVLMMIGIIMSNKIEVILSLIITRIRMEDIHFKPDNNI